MRKKILMNCIIFILCSANFKAHGVNSNSLYLGLGVLTHNLMRVSQNNTGESNFLGPLYYPLLAQTYIDFQNDWFFGPQIGYTALPRTAPDGGSKSSFLLINTPLLQHFGENDEWDWSVGPGFIFYIIQGTGGTTALNNGSGTSTFAQPSRTQLASTISLNLGVGYTYEYIHVGIDTITEGVLSSSRRSFSLMLYFTYDILGGTF
ncbi:MAG: hypothetical protein SGI74_04830 [Oligoflexia bacterium]|nr:hypothetical protein [Oligoflexia bacterium]